MAGLRGGIKTVAIYDPATGTTVQLNSIAADSTYTGEPIPSETTTGQVYGGMTHTLAVNFFDSGAPMTQLRAWMNADTPVKAVAIGPQAALLWYEPVVLSVNRGRNVNKRDGLNLNSLEMIFPGETSAIQSGINLADLAVKAAGFALGWGGAGAGDVADGYTEFNAIADPWSAGVQGFSWNSTGTTSAIRLEFEFPIAGAVFTGRSQLTATSGTGTRVIQIQSLNYAGTATATGSTEFEALGIESATLTTPAATYKVRFDPVFMSGLSGANTAAFRDPGLRLDGNDVYINH